MLSISLIPHLGVPGLKKAYNTPYIGDAAKEFVEYLFTCDYNVRNNRSFYYAKAVPVVQSSGTGKSRMLTEVRLYVPNPAIQLEPVLGWETRLYPSHLSPAPR